MALTTPLLSLLLLLLPTLSFGQIGTQIVNVTSDTSQFTYYSTWRSDTGPGYYEAYSNLSDASLTYTFTGVGCNYLAAGKKDRGLILLTVDGDQRYTVDLFDNSGFTQPLAVKWSSPTLPYGQHTINMTQLGIDARFGYYPYLITSIWEQVVPVNVASYTATEVVTTATTGTVTSPTGGSTGGSHSSNSHVAPIVGGVVGGLIALALAGFLVYLWRKDRRSSARGGGRMVEKVKKAQGGMVIEDDDVHNGHGRNGSGLNSQWGYQDSGMGGSDGRYSGYENGGGGGVWGGRSPVNGGNSDPYAQHHQNRQSYSHPSPSQWSPPPPPSSQNTYEHTPSYPQSAYDGYSSPVPFGASGAEGALAYGGGSGGGTGEWENESGRDSGSERRDSRAYPYQVQAIGGERRSYPVPEI